MNDQQSIPFAHFATQNDDPSTDFPANDKNSRVTGHD